MSATAAAQPANTTKQMIRRERGGMLSTSDDTALMKQIHAMHCPDGRELENIPVLRVIETILHHVSPGIDGVMNGIHDDIDSLEEKEALTYSDGILDGLSYIIHKISCELSCKCAGGGDAHATTVAIIGMVSSYGWDSKLVLSLAAFAVEYGDFWLITRLFATNPLAKSIGILKQTPEILENSAMLKPRFNAVDNLIKAILDVTKCIVHFKGLPTQYISDETPPMAAAIALIPSAVYWTVRSMVVCCTLITNLLAMNYEFMGASTETWELSSLEHKLRNVHDHLKEQLASCYQHIDETKHKEYFQMLVHLFEIPHLDNMKILKSLIYVKDDQLPLEVGTTKTRAHVDVLRRKTVLLLISDLDIFHEELRVLTDIYKDARSRQEFQYEIVWIPVVDRSVNWNDGYEEKFKHLQSMMPWYTIHHPSLLEPAVTRYIKEVWHFEKKSMLIALDQQGKVVCPNAIHMVWIWRNLSYPFSLSKEAALWNGETWRLELLVDSIDPAILGWIREDKYICLYGGEDIEWIRKFTSMVRNVATKAGINMEMVYVGKSNSKERVRKINGIIRSENLSHIWEEPTLVWYFWARLESMLYSKIQHGKSTQTDKIMQEVLTILTFDGTDHGWALISRGSVDMEMAQANGDMMISSLTEYPSWEEDAVQTGFIPALNNHLQSLHTPHHCNRLILPGISGGIPELVVCAECGSPMEKYFMYRCCTE